MNTPTLQPAEGSPVYCSGPMFSVGDQWEQAAVAATLEAAGYTTYLPQRDGIEVGKVMAMLNHPLLEGPIADEIMAQVRKWVFALDMYQLLERCQSLVFNLDGRTPDDGSVVETASAFVAGKPIVIYKTTPITMLAGQDNPMVEGLSSTWSYVSTVAAIPAVLATQVTAANAWNFTYDGPPNVTELMSTGQVVWTVLQALRSMPQNTPQEVQAWADAMNKSVAAETAATVA